MPPPLILSTLPPPLNAQPWPIEAPLPLVRWRFSSHLPLVRRLVVASTSASASRHLLSRSRRGVYPRPLRFVRASWLLCRISSQRLRLSTRHRLTTGCVVAVADAQASLPSSRLQLSPSSHPVELRHRPRRCRRRRPSPSSSLSYPVAPSPWSSSLLTSPVAPSPSSSTSPSVAPSPSSSLRRRRCRCPSRQHHNKIM